VTDNAEVAPANLCADTGIGVPFQRDAVTVQVGTIIRVEWDDAAWRRGSLADLPVLTLIGNEILTAFTNEEGEAVFPYHFSGETMFLVDNNAERNGELVIQTEAYRVVFDPDIPDTKSGVIRVLPMKAPGTVPDEPFGIEDALWFVDHWDQVGRDYDLNGVRDERNDRRALLQRIPPLVTLPYVLE